MGDEEGQRYADEDDKQELREPFGDVESVASHGVTVRAAGGVGRPADYSRQLLLLRGPQPHHHVA